MSIIKNGNKITSKYLLMLESEVLLFEEFTTVRL